MDLFESLGQAILKHGDNQAFCINGFYYSYRDLAKKISAIRLLLSPYNDMPEKCVGLVVNDDLETYASIISIWLEGRYYVPLSLQTPVERNEYMIRSTGLRIIIDSSDKINFPDYINLETKKIRTGEIDLRAVKTSGDALAYLLFTSGSTGIPKGVPITRNNLFSFVKSFLRIGLNTNEKDRWLQMFDLTFDLSIFSYFIPLSQGACVFTIPKNQIKFNYIFKLLDESHLTVALMIPSVIHFLRQYFNEIDNPHLKYSLFCGEALPADLIESWAACVPLAGIFNLYGPTEATIFCTCYSFNRNAANKTYNGFLSIGRPMHQTKAIVVDDKKRLVKDGVIGELCLSGHQITPGYLNYPGENESPFFEFDRGEGPVRYYKTGDLCSIDEDGDILFTGRLDSQIKINGFRVELSEIEFHTRNYLTGINVVALAYRNELEATEIGLIIEGPAIDTRQLISSLKKKLPSFMIPARIRFENVLPLNTNDKTDKKELLKRLLQ